MFFLFHTSLLTRKIILKEKLVMSNVLKNQQEILDTNEGKDE